MDSSVAVDELGYSHHAARGRHRQRRGAGACAPTTRSPGDEARDRLLGVPAPDAAHDDGVVRPAAARAHLVAGGAVRGRRLPLQPARAAAHRRRRAQPARRRGARLPARHPLLPAVGAPADPGVPARGSTSWPPRGASSRSATARPPSSAPGSGAARCRGTRTSRWPGRWRSSSPARLAGAGAVPGGRGRPCRRCRRWRSRSARPVLAAVAAAGVESMRDPAGRQHLGADCRRDRARRPRAGGRPVAGGGPGLAAARAAARRRS